MIKFIAFIFYMAYNKNILYQSLAQIQDITAERTV